MLSTCEKVWLVVLISFSCFRSITVSSERFRCAEGLFDPNKWGKDYDGIHKMVEKAIKQSGIDHRKELCK